MPAGPFSIGSALWPGISKLVEEAGEVTQVCGKLIGSGGDINHWDGTNLKERLEDEIGDLIAACMFVIVVCDLDWKRITTRWESKARAQVQPVAHGAIVIRCAECGQVECDKSTCPGWSTERPLFDRAWTAESLERRQKLLEPLFMAGKIVFPARFGGHPFAAEYRMVPYEPSSDDRSRYDSQRR